MTVADRNKEEMGEFLELMYRHPDNCRDDILQKFYEGWYVRIYVQKLFSGARKSGYIRRLDELDYLGRPLYSLSEKGSAFLKDLNL